jgi:hypothetical protein
LHWTSIKSNFSFLLNSRIDQELVNWISHPSISTSFIFFIDNWAILFWIFLLHGHRCLLSGVNEGEWNTEHKEDNEWDHECSQESCSGGEVSIFPNDIGWFTCLFDINFASKECSVVSIVFKLNSFIV